MQPLTAPGNWIVVVATGTLVLACIVLHYEVLSACMRVLPRISERRRRRVVFLIVAILVTHVVEIWLFGGGYFALAAHEPLGSISGLADPDWPDYIYYSAMVYTTVGFGDIVPVGPIRFMTGTEALLGLILITWSASFTFLEMQRDWSGRADKR